MPTIDHYLFNSPIVRCDLQGIDQPNLFGYNKYAVLKYYEKAYYAFVHLDDDFPDQLQIYLTPVGSDYFITYNDGTVMTTNSSNDQVQCSYVSLMYESTVTEVLDCLFLYLIKTLQRCELGHLV